ncbi:sulfurtransferase complex subunit TusD [Shewanella sp. A3A]|nr:sulfurtransferase complex subunit TusD [Shewanella ferrihydritica]
MQTFIILVSSTPLAPANGLKAIKFARAALSSGHQVHSVFFLGDGVYHGNSLTLTPSDETPLLPEWRQLQQEFNIPLINCATAAARRGVLAAMEAQEHGLTANLDAAFIAGGLVELVKGISQSDRVVRF